MAAYHSIARLLGTPNDQGQVVPGGNLTIPLAVTGTNTYTSPIMVAINTMEFVTTQIIVPTGGTASGTFTLSVSQDPASRNSTYSSQAYFTPIATVSVTGGAISAVTVTPFCFSGQTTGASTVIRFENGCQALQLSYTNSSGAGTVLAFASGSSGT